MLLDSLTLAVVEIASDYFRTAFCFGLFVVAVKNERSGRRCDWINVTNDIAVLVIREALIQTEAISLLEECE